MEIKIQQAIAADWRKLGTLLDFDGAGNYLNTIERDCKASAEDCYWRVMQHWLNGNGKGPATWRIFVKLLCQIGRSTIAEEIQSAL